MKNLALLLFSTLLISCQGVSLDTKPVFREEPMANISIGSETDCREGHIPVLLPQHLKSKSSETFFSSGIGGGIGAFTLKPRAKFGQAMSMGDDGELTYIDIDFATDLPGFVPTAFSSDYGGVGVQQIRVVGFNETTGDVMIALVDLDFASTPSALVTLRYIGSGFGIPLDLYAYPNALKKVIILDDLGTITMVNLISGAKTTLATTRDAPTLVNCNYIQANHALVEGEVVFRGLTAMEMHPISLRSGNLGGRAVVQCIDKDSDGVFDEFIER